MVSKEKNRLLVPKLIQLILLKGKTQQKTDKVSQPQNLFLPTMVNCEFQSLTLDDFSS